MSKGGRPFYVFQDWGPGTSPSGWAWIDGIIVHHADQLSSFKQLF